MTYSMSDQIKVGEISPFFIIWIFINKNCFMKQIFEILQEERARILEMHEDATKKQYLMELEEPGDPGFGATQSELNKNDNSQRALGAPEVKSIEKKPSYTTKNWNQFYHGQFLHAKVVSRGISKGTKFEVTNDPLKITAKNVNVFFADGNNWVKKPKLTSISFYCKQGKFYIQGEEKTPYVSETLSKALVKYVCGYKKEKSNNTQPEGTPKPTEEKVAKGKTKWKHVLKGETGDIVIPAESTIVNNQDKNGVSIKTKKGNWVWFNCLKGTFTFAKMALTPANDALKKSLQQNYCKKNDASQNGSQFGTNSPGSSKLGSSAVSKPNDTALDTILQKISGGQKSDETKQGPQTWEG